MTETPDPLPAPDETEDWRGPLPEVVRTRVVHLAADALGRLPTEAVPAPLRRVSSFAPGRRAKLAGTQIATVIETDEAFRGQVATDLRATHPELAASVDAAAPPAAADPVATAALLYVLRPEGWVKLLGEVTQTLSAERGRAVDERTDRQLEQVRRRLEAADAELRSLRDSRRAEVARLKGENAELRQKLGEVRARTRAADAHVEDLTQVVAGADAARAEATASLEAELRRTRARVEELESEVVDLRRAERAGRDTGTLRARLLMDTLLESAQGLRRELALPPVAGAPADRVAADVAEHGSRASSAHGSLAVDDPALLESLLTMPRSHLIVDGYNVTKAAFASMPLEQQRDRLVAALAPLAVRTSSEVTVVFDAAQSTERPLVNRPRHVRVLYSPVGVIADDVIRDLVAAEPPGRPLVVVTSDQAVVRDVERAGARVAAAAALVRLLSRS